jgi:hypothetical protein
MKSKFIILFTSFIIFACSNPSEEVEKDTEILPGSSLNNKKTPNHMLIDGTKISMLVPSGFMYEQKIFGFKQDAVHFIQTSEVQNLNFNRDFNTSTKEEFKKNFPQNEVKEYVKFKLNGYNALFIHYIKNNVFDYYELLFGDETFFCTVVGSSTLIKKDISKEIRNCILSLHYDKNLKVEQKNFENFKVNENKSEFKETEELPGLKVFSVDGKSIEDGDPSIYMTHFIFDKMQSVEIISKSNIESLTQNSFKPNSNKLGQLTFLNTVDDYVHITPGKMNGQDVNCIQIYNTEGNRCVVSISFMMGDYSEIVKEMKILSNATEVLD